MRDADVVPSVAGHLVTGRRDPLDHLWVALRHPPEGEERAPGAMAGQQVEDSVDGCLDARRQVVPAGARDASLEGRDLEVLLHVDAEIVGGHQPLR